MDSIFDSLQGVISLGFGGIVLGKFLKGYNNVLSKKFIFGVKDLVIYY